VLIFFLSALTLSAIHWRYRPKLGQTLVATVAAVVIGYAAFYAYVDYTLTNDPYGHNGRQLARALNPYNPVELLMQGRSEWLVMTTAIAERPIFGWGSWALDVDNRFVHLRAERIGIFYEDHIRQATSGIYIPSHSVLGSAWLWSGFLGSISVVGLLIIVIRMGFRLPTVGRAVLPLLTFFTIKFLWDFMFSPPQVVRLSYPVSIAVLTVLASWHAKKLSLLQTYHKLHLVGRT